MLSFKVGPYSSMCYFLCGILLNLNLSLLLFLIFYYCVSYRFTNCAPEWNDVNTGVCKWNGTSGPAKIFYLSKCFLKCLICKRFVLLLLSSLYLWLFSNHAILYDTFFFCLHPFIFISLYGSVPRPTPPHVCCQRVHRTNTTKNWSVPTASVFYVVFCNVIIQRCKIKILVDDKRWTLQLYVWRNAL